jgi:hypothetical protein
MADRDRILRAIIGWRRRWVLALVANWMRILAVTEIALLLAACTTAGWPQKDASTHAQSGSASQAETSPQVGGGGGGGGM